MLLLAPLLIAAIAPEPAAAMMQTAVAAPRMYAGPVKVRIRVTGAAEAAATSAAADQARAAPTLN
jgi:hypothetical protein